MHNWLVCYKNLKTKYINNYRKNTKQNEDTEVNMKMLKVRNVRTCLLLIAPAINVGRTSYGKIATISTVNSVYLRLQMKPA